MTVNDIPLISFFQRVLDPLIIMGTLYLSSMLFGEPFNGYTLVLMILAFFVSSAVYQHIDPYRTWRSGRMLAYARDTVFGWLLTGAVLLFLGKASGLIYFYDERVVLAWFTAVPLLMLTSHIAARRGALGTGKQSEVRSVVIVGANDVGLKFAAMCERQKNLFMQVEGFFDDRLALRHPRGLRQPVLGKMGDIASYVRQQHIKMIFISQPVSAQPRIRRLLDEVQDTTASVYFLPDIYIFDLMQARFDNVGGMPVI
ncbi:MAG: undecaprenyl-phosphate glucose phosphotransferase, partial [Bdellovibrionales bacterium]|nr:undecaprenyl-phosphate glucose phosphotransferase [Massilia sp.]